MQLFLYLNYTVIAKPQYKFSFDLMCWMTSTIMANSTNPAEAGLNHLNYAKQVLILISQVKINFLNIVLTTFWTRNWILV